ncbi:MAG: hypothetical protein GXP63_03795 [DPANN group archaeon]|nr:hypothetical protein [DPANN group archaeon]
MAEDKNSFYVLVLVAVVAIVGVIGLFFSMSISGQAGRFGMNSGSGGGFDMSQFQNFDQNQFRNMDRSQFQNMDMSQFKNGNFQNSRNGNGMGLNLRDYLQPTTDCIKAKADGIISSCVSSCSQNDREQRRACLDQCKASFQDEAKDCINQYGPDPAKECVSHCTGQPDEKSCAKDCMKTNYIDPAKSCVSDCKSAAEASQDVDGFKACAQNCISGYLS